MRYRLRWKDVEVATVGRVGPLRRRTELVPVRRAADPAEERTYPGRTTFPAVTLEQVVTTDAAFDAWAREESATPVRSLAERRFRPLVLEVHDSAGDLVVTYTLHRCWVSAYEAVPELDAEAVDLSGGVAAPGTVVIARLVVEHSGWDRAYPRR
jgi:phage tail-like protein